MNVNLSKNSWHYKLQQFSYGCDPYDYNLCPYFWNTVFCIVGLPLTLIGKVTRKYTFPTTTNVDVFQREHNARKSNIEAGFLATAIGTLATLVLMVFGLVLFIIVTTLMSGAVSAPFIFGMLIGFGLIAGAIKTSELWVPYLISAKNKVCPGINWKEDSTPQ